MTDIEQRYRGKIRIHIRDELFGNSMVVTTTFTGKERDDVLSKVKERFNKYTEHIDTKISEKSLHNHAKYLIEDEKWSKKRVKNHFAKFGIDIEPFLDAQKKLNVPL